MLATEVKKQHPCFSGGNNKGRIHLPVSPTCNIMCKFCDRQINSDEIRPGVTATIMKPEQANEAIEKALELCPEITVAGIAGPGDTLASDNALETFRLIDKNFPQIIKCMSTNGLLLVEKADEIIKAKVNTLTVTVNAVDPKILAQLCSGIVYHGKHKSGENGAKILIENQIKGIELMAKAGIVVKVNTVLVPDINGNHIAQIAKAVAKAGAEIYNIIPLIPQHELSHLSVPTCTQIDEARQQAQQYINVFRHCQHCRADAVGVPGQKDFGEQLYLNRIKDTFSHG